ncbi:hypothetical protein PVAND_003392 [Polypedilum vanderplanki]|uniref:MULE transposase domain-containing protein n=1 Tax=Polypedilum vanderplanki TaxID=319348 RepID=A0A9J6BTX1_POLVA|nr:hypothetical protein PVAND_003392 [Polypedilum vanderplanki]
MNIENIQGLRKNSEVFYVPIKDAIYLIKEKKNSKIYVNCYFADCSAKGTIENGLFYDTSEHEIHKDHLITTKALIAKFELYQELRKRSKTVGSSLKNIFDKTYMEFKPKLENIIVTYPSIRGSMQNWRRENCDLPKNPTSINDILEQIDCISSNEQFCLNEDTFVHQITPLNDGGGRSIALYSQKILEKILRLEEKVTAYCDSTFRFFPSFFHQLMIFHFNIGKHAFATIFIFMERKNVTAYLDVFTHLKDLGISFDELVLDFESAPRKAALEIYPDIKLSPCHFHLGQCLFRKMKQFCNTPNTTLLRKLQCLAMLPPEMIKETYIVLKSHYTQSEYKKFFKYFENQWMQKVKPKNFSVYGTIQRTNNICESFNSYLKNYESENINITSNSNFWNVIELLLQFYNKMNVQLTDYINSGFQKNIRTKNKIIAKIQKESVIKTLYHRLSKGMAGIDFIEALYPKEYEKLYEKFAEEMSNESESTWNEMSSEEEREESDEGEDETSI